MYRFGWALFLIMALLGCGEEKKKEKKAKQESRLSPLHSRFPAASTPYILVDTSLLSNTDTASLNDPGLVLPDSLLRPVFAKSSVRFIPLVHVKINSGEIFYIVKAVGGGKTAAYLIPAVQGGWGPVLPFLVPDRDPASLQSSSIDRNGSISRTMAKKINDQAAEGREVFSYDEPLRQFHLVMTDMLDDRDMEVINPIDTLSKKHRFAGDYFKGEDNIVSVRDSRYPNQLTVFIHTSKDGGDCQGEIKADVLMTSSTTAIYRQGGDPCILELRFTPNAVVLREQEGCGSRRGMDCVFDGSYTRKKETEASPRREP